MFHLQLCGEMDQQLDIGIHVQTDMWYVIVTLCIELLC